MLFLFTFGDLFQTVFMIGGGAGPQSTYMARSTWKWALNLHSTKSKRSHSMMRAVGPFIVLMALATWVLQLVLAWALILVPTAFSDKDGVSFSDRLLFAAKSIIGRSGNSPEIRVIEGPWEIIESISGITGVIVVTVGLAYVLPILGAVVAKRSVAATIGTLGDDVDSMIRRATLPGGSSFELHLVALISSISEIAERHRSYPVLHYFHSKDSHAALATSIAKLSLLLKSNRSDMDRVDPTVVEPLAHAIHNLLDALSIMGLKDFAHRDKRIDSNSLHQLNINPDQPPTTNRLPHSEWLKAYVLFDGWDWDAIRNGAEKTMEYLQNNSD